MQVNILSSQNWGTVINGIGKIVKGTCVSKFESDLLSMFVLLEYSRNGVRRNRPQFIRTTEC